MSSSKKTVTFVSNKIPEDILAQTCSKIEEEFNITLNKVNQIQDFFPLLSDPNYNTDYICIDIEDLFSNIETNMFELVNTLHTLIKCTVKRSDEEENSVKPTRRNTKIFAIVSDTTSVELIKDVLTNPNISGLTLKIGGEFGYEDVSDSIRKMLTESSELPKKIQDKLSKKKRLNDNTNSINLTPRQQQIFNLVADRGASNKVIAKMLNISESTVKLHMGSIFKKYRVRNRTQLAVFAKNNQLK